jgi:Coenzyme PQQ synthesis protein D (PqqD)
MTELTLRADDLHWREVDDEIVALEARGATYLAANRSGTLLWRMLARGATSNELAAALVDAYGIDPAAAAADADRFVEQVREAGLLAA